jgi:hypothetical protein
MIKSAIKNHTLIYLIALQKKIDDTLSQFQFLLILLLP